MENQGGDTASRHRDDHHLIPQQDARIAIFGALIVDERDHTSIRIQHGQRSKVPIAFGGINAYGIFLQVIAEMGQDIIIEVIGEFTGGLINRDYPTTGALPKAGNHRSVVFIEGHVPQDIGLGIVTENIDPRFDQALEGGFKGWNPFPP